MALSLCGTHLDDNNQHLHPLDAFTLYTNNNLSTKGGVACYVKSSVQCQIMNDCTLMSNSLESLFLQCSLDSENIIIGTIYRRPGTDVDFFLRNLNSILHCVNGKNMKSYIAGDFNLNLIRYNTNECVRTFADAMFNKCFYPCTHKVTRVAKRSTTLIDSIWTNDVSSTKTNGILLSDSSDHFAPFLIFDSPIKSTQSASITISYRDFKHSSDEDIKAIISEQVAGFSLSNNVNSDFNSLSHILSDVSKLSFPVKTKTIKQKTILKPWFKQELKEIINERQKLYKKFLRRPITYGQEYRRYRNFVNLQIKEAKSSYYKRKLDDAIGNSKKTWNVLSQILNNKTNRATYINKIRLNNIIIDDGNAICHEFNNHFTSIGSKMTSTLRRPTRRPQDFLQGIFPTLPNFHHTNDSEIRKIILNLKTCSPGHDDIHANVIKIGIDILSPVLVQIINNSFDSGIFPDILKIAKVTPIFKSGDRLDTACYRPISILPCLSKIIERLIYERMWIHIEENEIITKAQFGFIRGLSIENAIISILSKVLPNYDANKIVIGVFLDLSKAFDVIDHNILLLKLKHYGFVGNTLTWFKSYLCNRYQFTKIDNCQSVKLPLALGVP